MTKERKEGGEEKKENKNGRFSIITRKKHSPAREGSILKPVFIFPIVSGTNLLLLLLLLYSPTKSHCITFGLYILSATECFTPYKIIYKAAKSWFNLFNLQQNFLVIVFWFLQVFNMSLNDPLGKFSWLKMLFCIYLPSFRGWVKV